MHMRNPARDIESASIPVELIVEDPEGLTGSSQREWHLTGIEGESILELALRNGIQIEHSCGGVCACSTCHIYLEEGASSVSEADEDEEDRVEEAPGLQVNSRLSCQCIFEGQGPIKATVPAWNRNAVKEVPH